MKKRSKFSGGINLGDFWETGNRHWLSNIKVIIDTPDEPLEMIAAAETTDVQAILITHNHWDHIEGFDIVTDKFAVPVGIGENDAAAISDREGYRDPIDVSQDNILQVGEISIRCIETPGHTPGSTCFMLPGDSPAATPHLFSGDTLFPGGPGKTGSPEAFEQIVDSVSNRLLSLPSESVVMPGHGDFTTIERSAEEYAVFAANPHEPGLFGEVTWQ